MSFTSLLSNCNAPKLKGMKENFFVAPISDLDGYPLTKAQVAIAASETPASGDTKRLGEAFTYVTDGYHRQFNILVDTGSATNTLEGEIGGQENRARMNYFIPGNTPEVREFIDCLVQYSGCMNFVGPTKDGQHVVIGDDENPAFVESYEGGTGGDRNGYEVVVYSGAPTTYKSIDLSEFPLGLTPAV